MNEKEKNKDEFVWTDELALEFSVSPYATISPLRKGLEQFKASKQRKPLFVTVDGVGVFEGDEYWFIGLTTFNVFHVSTVTKDSYYEGKKFSTEAAAKEYVRLNQPLYSLNDVKRAWEKFTGGCNIEMLITELEKLKP